MARAIWSGSISFGLVSIPVKLFAATATKTVRFHQIEAATGARVRQQRVSEADGSEVAYDQIVKGYELASGRHVVITDDELSALDPKASRTIDLLEFVDQSSIDPMFYDSAYYLAPDPATVKPYALLLRAMGEADKVGIARFVMRSREHLCALRPRDGVMVLSTMRYADEIRGVDDLNGLEDLEEVTLTAQELKMAAALIESLDAEFDPDQFRDTYREKVLELIERKEQGHEGVVEPVEVAEEGNVIDLMAALQASVAEAKSARGRHPTGSGQEDEETDAPASRSTAKSPAGKRPASKKAPAKKAAAKKAPAKKKAAPAKAPAKKKAAAKKAAPVRKSA